MEPRDRLRAVPEPYKVLIVEDERVVAKDLKLTLESYEPDTDVDDDIQDRYSFVYEYAPFQYLQLRGGIRYYYGVEGDDLLAEVIDDGVGLGPEVPPGVGLGSMRERAALVGGELEIEGEEGHGTSVRLRVPLPQGPPE